MRGGEASLVEMLIMARLCMCGDKEYVKNLYFPLSFAVNLKLF